MMADTSTWADGTVIEALPFLVSRRQESQTKNGMPYLSLSLKGNGGHEISAKVWSDHLSLFDLLTLGSVVQVSGRLQDYQGRLSMNIDQVATSDLDPAEFVRRTKQDVDRIWRDLRTLVESMTEPLTRFIALHLLDKPGFENAFKKAPAASKIHNNWVGGLIEHVHSLCQLAEGVVSHYQRMYEAPISRDKVLFGLIFHDAGKIHEYDLKSPSFELSSIGHFVPHIVLGPAWVYEAAQHFPEGKADPIELAHLMHLLAAHHGTKEWGSPVEPVSLEALVVHHLDNLDSKVLHALNFVMAKSGPEAGFSERSWTEKRAFFQPGIGSSKCGGSSYGSPHDAPPQMPEWLLPVKPSEQGGEK